MLRTELRPLSSLNAHPRNPKAHAIEDLVASIERFGFVEPVVVDDRTDLLLAGHGRVVALRTMEARGLPPPAGVEVLSTEAGPAWGVPVVVGFATADDEEALAFLVAANQLTTLGGWDGVALARLLAGSTEPDLRGLGFTERDVRQLARVIPAPAAAAKVKEVPAAVAQLVAWATCPHCGHRFPK